MSGQLRWRRDGGLLPTAHPCGAVEDRLLFVFDMAWWLETNDFLGEAFRAEFAQRGEIDILREWIF